MININDIKAQANALQRCIDNYEAASDNLDIHSLSPSSTVKDNIDAHNLLDRTWQTLIGQLKLMNIQNQELLK